MANGQNSTQITVKVFDDRGDPLSDADIYVALIAGADDFEQSTPVNEEGGVYTAEKATAVTGWAKVLVRERNSDLSEFALVGFAPGPADRMLMSVARVTGSPER